VGIATLDDLILKTRDKKEKDELALRLLIPKERLIHWVEKAQLVQLKGLGAENLSVLERVGIHSISALASEDPEKLYERIEQVFQGRPVLKNAKIRIWVNEARKIVRGRGDS
jgi:nucleotidyltransferase/DNA polymerase involved in DNA repair